MTIRFDLVPAKALVLGEAVRGREDCTVQLAPHDAALVRLLAERFPETVSERELVQMLWPNRHPSVHARQVRLMQLRRKLTTAGLALRYRRGYGYSLDRGVGAVPARP